VTPTINERRKPMDENRIKKTLGLLREALATLNSVADAEPTDDADAIDLACEDLDKVIETVGEPDWLARGRGNGRGQVSDGLAVPVLRHLAEHILEPLLQASTQADPARRGAT
jgi:hypothetical protein